MMDSACKKKILFIVTYDYLALPLYESLSIILNDYKSFLGYYYEPFIKRMSNAQIKNESKIWDEIIDYQPDELKDLESIIKTRKYFRKILPFFSLLVKYKKGILNSIFNEVQPDLIVLTTDLTFTFRVVQKEASKKNIPLVLFQPSFINTIEHNFLNTIRTKVLYLLFNKVLNIPIFNKQTNWGNESSKTEKFLWGRTFADVVKNSSVKIVGNPLLKRYFDLKKDEDTVTQLRKKIGIKNMLPVVTLCTEGFTGLDVEKTVNDFYVEILQNINQVQFIIKVHPRDDFFFFQKLANEINSNVIVVKDIQLLDIYSLTDVQVSVNSYSSIEAILCNIPVILIKRTILNLPNYFGNNVVLNADTICEFQKRLQEVLSTDYKDQYSAHRKAYLEKVFGGSDPRETNEKILLEIRKILE